MARRRNTRREQGKRFSGARGELCLGWVSEVSVTGAGCVVGVLTVAEKFAGAQKSALCSLLCCSLLAAL
jgi:hypothetical protein